MKPGEIVSRYSKPSGDISREISLLVSEQDERFRTQQRLAATLERRPPRQHCVCCGATLRGPVFGHHGARFTECAGCGHVQSSNQPSPGYPHDVAGGLPFSKVYPPLEPEEYADRRDRIYTPKLDWIFSTLSAIGQSESQLRDKRWLEIGSGAGYFLSAANRRGVRNLAGLEADEQLAAASELRNPDVATVRWAGQFEEALNEHEADVYCSFFVHEHLDALPPVWEAMRRRPAGTVFVFSVPLFGFSCLLEQAFPEAYARNLDGVVHTQLFTEASIRYALEAAGCALVGEWVFGQDSLDLTRLMRMVGDDGLHATRIHSHLTTHLGSAQDAIQQALDRNRLADQRHLLAIRS